MDIIIYVMEDSMRKRIYIYTHIVYVDNIYDSLSIYIVIYNPNPNPWSYIYIYIYIYIYMD